MQHLMWMLLVLGASLSCSKADQPTVCRITDRPPSAILEMLTDHLESCVLAHYDREEIVRLLNPPDEETSMTNLRRFCNATATMELCFGQLTRQAGVCLDQHLLLAYTVVRDNWEGGVRVVCSDHGERIAMIISRGEPFNVRTRQNCAHTFNFNDTDNVDLAKSTTRFYSGFKSYRQCVTDLLGHGEENRALSETISSLITDILKEMKCVTTDNETVQHCENMANAAN